VSESKILLGVEIQLGSIIDFVEWRTIEIFLRWGTGAEEIAGWRPKYWVEFWFRDSSGHTIISMDR